MSIKTWQTRWNEYTGGYHPDVQQNCMQAEIDELRAELASIKGQKAIGYLPRCAIEGDSCGCKGGCIETVDVYLAAGAQPVPEGYQLVPIEPTEAMIKAGGHVNSEWLNDNAPIGEKRYTLPMGGVYKAMLAAAKEQP